MNPAGTLALKLVLTPALVGGAIAFMAFFFVLAELIETSIALAFLAALAVALAMQAASLVVGRRLGLA
ncbi:MAG TPA: hypothetical protein VN906_03660 [Candidatus Sulfotelmatobacter sp.]|nr:hypothetical protein [Candidatus Sulfotelmatobacter sp.]